MSGTSGRPFAADLLSELFRHPLDPGYADAARRRAESGPRTGWRRRGTRAVAVLVLTALGFLLAVAYRQTLAEEPVRTRTRAGLVGQVQSRQTQTDGLQRRAQELRGEVAALRDALLTDRDAARLRDLEAVTGLAPVQGDAVVIRFADGPPPADPGGNKPNLGRVMDRDLQAAANALWSLGAEAIAINGQRLTAISTIREAGEAILVEKRPVLGPYEMIAIGPDDLEEQFVDSPAALLFRRLVGEVGMSFEVGGADGVTLPAAVPKELEYARVPAPSPSAGSAAPGSSAAPGGSVAPGGSAAPGPRRSGTATSGRGGSALTSFAPGPPEVPSARAASPGSSGRAAGRALSRSFPEGA